MLLYHIWFYRILLFDVFTLFDGHAHTHLYKKYRCVQYTYAWVFERWKIMAADNFIISKLEAKHRYKKCWKHEICLWGMILYAITSLYPSVNTQIYNSTNLVIFDSREIHNIKILIPVHACIVVRLCTFIPIFVTVNLKKFQFTKECLCQKFDNKCK